RPATEPSLVCGPGDVCCRVLVVHDSDGATKRHCRATVRRCRATCLLAIRNGSVRSHALHDVLRQHGKSLSICGLRLWNVPALALSPELLLSVRVWWIRWLWLRRLWLRRLRI